MSKIENVVVNSSKWIDSDIETLYGDEEVYYTDETELSRLMVELGVFKSTSQARRANRHGVIPSGWTEYKASRKRFLFIWNPDE